VATHELTSIDTSDRLISLRDGEVVYDGTPVDADIDQLASDAPAPRAAPGRADGAVEAEADGDAAVEAEIGEE
jgi:ABC-type multidrug transport system ATPase subunit